FEEVRVLSNAYMRKVVDYGDLERSWGILVERTGPFGRLGSAKVSPHGEGHVVDVVTEFARWTVDLQVTMDADGLVAGFSWVNPCARRSDAHVLELRTDSGPIAGTLDLPDGKGPWPVVLVIAGSGPTNRDGNNLPFQNNHLKLLGEALARQGVAVLRYDKRGVGESAGALKHEEDLRIEHLAADAAGWVKRLRADKRFTDVVIVGCSEGGLVAMLAAPKARPAALVCIACPGRPARQVLLEQLAAAFGSRPAWFREAKLILASLQEGRTVKDVVPPLRGLLGPSRQPYLISLLRYDPARVIARLDLRILLLQGTKDLQVKVKDAEVLAKAQPRARLVLLEGMNHVLKTPAPDDERQTKTYVNGTMPIHGALVRALVPFVKTSVSKKVISAADSE
ncbi:MAG: alpha/beta fold hydrolase, partial [Planctomycetota bacterium]